MAHFDVQSQRWKVWGAGPGKGRDRAPAVGRSLDQYNGLNMCLGSFSLPERFSTHAAFIKSAKISVDDKIYQETSTVISWAPKKNMFNLLSQSQRLSGGGAEGGMRTRIMRKLRYPEELEVFAV